MQLLANWWRGAPAPTPEPDLSEKLKNFGLFKGSIESFVTEATRNDAPEDNLVKIFAWVQKQKARKTETRLKELHTLVKVRLLKQHALSPTVIKLTWRLTKNPKDANAAIRLANLYKCDNLKKRIFRSDPEVLRLLMQAHGVQPENLFLLASFGDYYRFKEDEKGRAIAVLNQALDVLNTIPEVADELETRLSFKGFVYAALSNTALCMGDVERATNWLKQALECDRDSPFVQEVQAISKQREIDPGEVKSLERSAAKNTFHYYIPVHYPAIAPS